MGEANTIRFVRNSGGPTLGYSTSSGVTILEEDGLKFKDLNKDGRLDPYEDWRLSPEERAKDLASKMTIEQIAGLMLYSPHQSIPARSRGWFPATYGGQSYEESGANAWDLTDQQIEFLRDSHVRHVLVTTVDSPLVAARWSNKVQAFAESTHLGIPANNSSDPRHGADSSAEFNAGAGGKISMWPESLGLAATFDPGVVRRFGEVASAEYRALGITTALSPQIDIATDPRWFRFNGTFGEDTALATDMARAYVDGFQTSVGNDEIGNGWGFTSVNAMVKHWPGGGSGEGGRDAHYGCGKFAVYPGNHFDEHLTPFVEGAFKLEGKTKKASAVMPYYTISWNQDAKTGENVGNAYNAYLINDLLRKKYQYDGVVCTDWMVTADESKTKDSFLGGKSWGVEGLSVAARHLKLLLAGVDQFGGNHDIGPVLSAYHMGVDQYGESFMKSRFEQSAIRLLLNVFRTGLFENPYVDEGQTVETVGNPRFMEEGYQAQLKSIVLLKNQDDVLPLAASTRVFIPKRFTPPGRDWFGNPTPESLDYPINLDIARRYFTVVSNADDADVAIVVVRGPKPGTGFSYEDVDQGGTGYVPISLQYRPYTAVDARAKSIAGDAREGDVLNRSYREKSVHTFNESDLDLILDTAKLMEGKPVIVSLLLANPAVVNEFESVAHALLVNFGVQDQALLDVISGNVDPSGLLPMQMPSDMLTVEAQLEDVAHDMDCHVDSEGHAYDFGFGMNFSGVIRDDRVLKYEKHRDSAI